MNMYYSVGEKRTGKPPFLTTPCLLRNLVPCTTMPIYKFKDLHLLKTSRFSPIQDTCSVHAYVAYRCSGDR